MSESTQRGVQRRNQDAWWHSSYRDQKRPVPLPEICDAPTVCLRLNSEWASHVAGAIAPLADGQLWEGTDNEKWFAAQQISRLVEMLSVLCPDPAADMCSAVAAENDKLRLRTGDTGDPHDIHPDAPVEAWDRDDTDTPEEAACRPSSLCAVVKLLVNQLADGENQRRGGLASLASLGGFFLGQLAATGWVANPAAGALAFAGMLLSPIALGLQAISQAVLTDAQAREELVCCILSNLYGQNVNPTTFAASCDSCPCGQSGNLEQLRGAMCPFFSDHDTYLRFLELVGMAMQGCADELLEDCTCEDWCADFNFLLDDYGFTNLAGGCGGWSLGVGMTTGDTKDPLIIGPRYRRICKVAFHPQRTITRAEITYNFTLGQDDGMPPTLNNLMLRLQGQNVIFKDHTEIAQGTGRVATWSGCIDNVASTEFRVICSVDDTDPEIYDGSAVVTRLRLWGRGTSPFTAPPCA